MKRKATKLVALALALGMGLSIFSGCTDDGNKDSNTSPSPSSSSSATPSSSPSEGSSTKIVDTPITLKVLTTAEAGITLTGDTAVFKELSNRTNINFTIEELPLVEPLQKLNLIMASKDLPDLFANTGATKDFFDKYGSEGALIDIKDLVKEHAPNIQAAFDNPPFGDTPIADLYSEGGKLYIIPVYSHPQPGAVWCIREDWLKKVNMNVPTTVDEFTAVLKAFKDQNVNGNGNVIPLSFNGADSVRAIENFFGVHMDFYLDPASDTIKYGPLDEGWKEAAEYINSLYKDGLLDSEYLTNDGTIFDQKVTENRVGAFYGWPMSGLEKSNGLIKAVDANAHYTTFAPLKKDASTTTGLKEGKQATQIIRSAISSSNKYPVETIKLLDYLFTEEGIDLTNWGIEGEDYTVTNGEKKFVDSILNDPDGVATARGKRGIQRAFPFVASVEAEYSVASDDIVKAWTTYNESGALAPLMPGVAIPEEKQSRFNSIKTQIDTYRKEKEAAFFTGTEDVSTGYDAFKKELETRGINEILQIYNDAYTEYKANAAK